MVILEVLPEVIGLLGGLFGGSSNRPSAPSGHRWVKGWYVGGAPTLHYAAAATILESLSTGLPVGRWSTGEERMIPARAINSQGVPVFADEVENWVEEAAESTWELLGSSTERNAAWAALIGQPGPSSRGGSSSGSSGSSGSLGLIMGLSAAIALILIIRKARG